MGFVVGIVGVGRFGFGVLGAGFGNGTVDLGSGWRGFGLGFGGEWRGFAGEVLSAGCVGLDRVLARGGSTWARQVWGLDAEESGRGLAVLAMSGWVGSRGGTGRFATSDGLVLGVDDVGIQERRADCRRILAGEFYIG